MEATFICQTLGLVRRGEVYDVDIVVNVVAEVWRATKDCTVYHLVDIPRQT
jgi:hypothetical protein